MKEQQAKWLQDGGFIKPGAAQWVITQFVGLFVVCQTLILPEGKTAHYRNRDSNRDKTKRQTAVFE